jgi:TetR/AcrR family transcriptional repressor of mexJK operon
LVKLQPSLLHISAAWGADLAFPTEYRTDIRQRRILVCATELFLTHGYEGTNIESIAMASGVSKATIYSFFKDKPGLVSAVIRNAGLNLAAACNQGLDETGDIEEVLTRFASSYIRGMLRNIGKRSFYEISRLVLELSHEHREIVEVWRDILVQAIGEPLRAYLQAQIDRSVLTASYDATFLTVHFTQSLFYCAVTIVAPDGVGQAPKQSDVDELATRKVRLFLRGCSATKAFRSKKRRAGRPARSHQ